MCAKCQEAEALLVERFGEDLAETLLWEQTCFPMDGDICLSQAKALIAINTPAALDANDAQAKEGT